MTSTSIANKNLIPSCYKIRKGNGLNYWAWKQSLKQQPCGNSGRLHFLT